MDHPCANTRKLIDLLRENFDGFPSHLYGPGEKTPAGIAEEFFKTHCISEVYGFRLKMESTVSFLSFPIENEQMEYSYLGTMFKTLEMANQYKEQNSGSIIICCC